MAFDLDEEEYKATRILTGADKMDEYIYNRYNGIITKYKKIVDNKYICIETGITIDLEFQLMLGKTSEDIIDLVEARRLCEWKVSYSSIFRRYKKIYKIK